MSITSLLKLTEGFKIPSGSLKAIFVKVSQNFIKSHLRFCLISQISVHSLWHVWVQAWKFEVYESATCTNLQPVSVSVSLSLKAVETLWYNSSVVNDLSINFEVTKTHYINEILSFFSAHKLDSHWVVSWIYSKQNYKAVESIYYPKIISSRIRQNLKTS